MKHFCRLSIHFSLLLFIVLIIAEGCKSKPEESKLYKTTKQLFFDAELNAQYKDVRSYYTSNHDLIDSKLFANRTADPTPDPNETDHVYMFQKHPMFSETLKAGVITIMKRMGDSTGFKEILYFRNAEEAEKCYQEIDAKLRPSSQLVTTADSAGFKKVEFMAETGDVIKGVQAIVTGDSTETGRMITLNVLNHQ